MWSSRNWARSWASWGSLGTPGRGQFELHHPLRVQLPEGPWEDLGLGAPRDSRAGSGLTKTSMRPRTTR